MKWLSILTVVFLSLPHWPTPAMAAEGCVRPLGGPCVSGPTPESNICKTRFRSCKVSLAKGAACKCRGVKGIVR